MIDAELTHIVERALAEALSLHELVRKPWLVQQIARTNLQPSDSDFAKACAYHTIADVLGRVMRKSKDHTTVNPLAEQLTLPGYRRVQTHYAVDRGDEACFVAVHRMTARERREKVAALRSQGHGVLQHADELEALSVHLDRIDEVGSAG